MATSDGGEQACRAVVVEGEAPPNPLFTPPCDCPRCAPSATYDHAGGRDGWLRLPGDEQRHRVEVVDLGEVGRAAL